MGEQPDEEIVHLAEDIGAGLIVMDTRGFSGLKRAFLRNVADFVVRHAYRPVLIVRPVEDPESRHSLH